MELTVNPTYTSICELIGVSDATKLSWMFGGRFIEIPLNAKPRCQLSIAIGVDKTQKIVDVYGGMRFYVPIVHGRIERVSSLRQSGKTLNQIAEEEKISVRTVQKALAKKADDNQASLFE